MTTILGETAVNGLSWRWIALMAIVPPILAILAAMPIWRSRQVILGNLLGSGVIFACALGLIMRESLDLTMLTRRCLDSGYTCWPDPSAFVRHAIYSGIALIEVFALFTYSLRVEEKIRRRGYSPEWR